MRKPIVQSEESDAAVEALADEALAVLDEGTNGHALMVEEACSPSNGVSVAELVPGESTLHSTDEAGSPGGTFPAVLAADAVAEAPEPSPAGAASEEGVLEIAPILESLLFVSPEPLTVDRCASILGHVTKSQVREALALMAHDLDRRGSGLQLVQVAGGYRFVTRPQYASWIRRLEKTKSQAKLSRSAVEALAIIAYRQPVVRGELEKIRGVETSGVIRTLLERKLVRIVGRKDEPGRPIMYGTTKQFLEHFGLRDLSELPPLREFKELGEGDQSSLLEEMGLEAGAPEGGAEGGSEQPLEAVNEAGPDVGESSDEASGDDSVAEVGSGPETGLPILEGAAAEDEPRLDAATGQSEEEEMVELDEISGKVADAITGEVPVSLADNA